MAETRSQILADYHRSPKDEAATTELVCRWIVSGHEVPELLRLAGGITTGMLIAGQAEAVHAQYVN